MADASLEALTDGADPPAVVAVQHAEGETRDGLGGFGMGVGLPPSADLVDLAFRAPAKGMRVDAGGLKSIFPPFWLALRSFSV